MVEHNSNLDKEILDLEAALGFGPGFAPGTMINRVLVDLCILRKEDGIERTPEENSKGYAMIWSLALGKMSEPKQFFYGRTIAQAIENAKRQLLER